jgi:hypothetical protein
MDQVGLPQDELRPAKKPRSAHLQLSIELIRMDGSCGFEFGNAFGKATSKLLHGASVLAFVIGLFY